jgi:hypothetical protein
MNAIPPDRLSNRPPGVAKSRQYCARKNSVTASIQTPNRRYDGKPKANFDQIAQISTYKHLIDNKYFDKNLNWFSRNWLRQEVWPANNNKYQK